MNEFGFITHSKVSRFEAKRLGRRVKHMQIRWVFPFTYTKALLLFYVGISQVKQYFGNIIWRSILVIPGI